MVVFFICLIVLIFIILNMTYLDVLVWFGIFSLLLIFWKHFNHYFFK